MIFGMGGGGVGDPLRLRLIDEGGVTSAQQRQRLCVQDPTIKAVTHLPVGSVLHVSHVPCCCMFAVRVCFGLEVGRLRAMLQRQLELSRVPCRLRLESSRRPVCPRGIIFVD